MRRLISQFSAYDGLRRYTLNTSWMIVERVVRMTVTFFVGIYLLRYLGPSDYGLLSYAVSFAGMFTFIATFGLEPIMIRELVNRPAESAVIMGSGFVLKLALSCFMLFLVLIVAVCFINDTVLRVMICVIAAGVILQSFNVVTYFFEANVQAKYLSIALAIQLVLSASLKIFLIASNATLKAFAFVYLADSVVLAIALLAVYRFKGFDLFNWRFDTAIAKKLVKDSWKIGLAGALVAIYMRVDVLMLLHLSGEQSAGIYAAAVRISEAWFFIPMTICASLFPAIILAKEGPRDKFRLKMYRLFRLLIWLGLTVALVLTFVANPLVKVMLGDAYTSSGPVLVVLLWSGVFVFLGIASGKWMVSEGFSNKILARSATGAVINIVFNIVLIPLYGALGAAVSTFAAYICVGYLFDLFDAQLREMFALKTRSIFLPFSKLK